MPQATIYVIANGILQSQTDLYPLDVWSQQISKVLEQSGTIINAVTLNISASQDLLSFLYQPTLESYVNGNVVDVRTWVFSSAIQKVQVDVTNNVSASGSTVFQFKYHVWGVGICHIDAYVVIDYTGTPPPQCPPGYHFDMATQSCVKDSTPGGVDQSGLILLGAGGFAILGIGAAVFLRKKRR